MEKYDINITLSKYVVLSHVPMEGNIMNLMAKKLSLFADVATILMFFDFMIKVIF